MLELVRLLLATLVAAVRCRQRLVVENVSASSTPPSSRQALLALRPAPAPGLETPPAPDPAGDRAELAPPGVASLLALALRPHPGTSTAERRGPRADRDDGGREPALGH